MPSLWSWWLSIMEKASIRNHKGRFKPREWGYFCGLVIGVVYRWINRGITPYSVRYAQKTFGVDHHRKFEITV